MRSIIAFCVVALVVAGFAPRYFERFGVGVAAPVPTSVAAPVPAVAPAYAASSAPSLGPRTVTIRKDERGHFAVEGQVDGRRVGFMVDTGASVIALTERDAGRLGYHPAYRDYRIAIRTANGTIRGAPISLGMVEVGGVMVRNVDAIVLPDEALSENLLGLSFLSRLRRFEYREGHLVLEE
jgi:aspartyl protease family protein